MPGLKPGLPFTVLNDGSFEIRASEVELVKAYSFTKERERMGIRQFGLAGTNAQPFFCGIYGPAEAEAVPLLQNTLGCHFSKPCPFKAGVQ